MVIADMETSTPIEESFLDTFEVSSSTASAIQISWHIRGSNLPFVEGFRVHYQKVASTYIQYGPKLLATDNEYKIGNLVADTYYKVCLVVYRNDSIPFRECADASTTNWEVPVSLGSSIGAVLALSMIVFIVLLSRCKIPMKYRRKTSKKLQKYDTISSNYHDEHYEFSETATHGQEDDYTSEVDQEDENYFEIHSSDIRKHRQFLPDKPGISNGLCKPHANQHQFGHRHSQQRNSLGRIHFSQLYQYQHGRQLRAYSIQPDGNASFFNQPCSPLAKECKHNSIGQCSQQSDSIFNDSSDIPGRKRPAAKEIGSSNFEMPTVHKLCSISSQVIAFIDENSDNSSLPQSHGSNENNANSKREESDSLLIAEIDLDDMSKLGAVGGCLPSDIPQKSFEMSTSNRIKTLPESVTFDEHSV